MNKAFIFDLDGVLINSELPWQKEEKKIFKEFLDKKAFQQLGSTVGLDALTIYKKIVQLGADISFQEMQSIANIKAQTIYKKTPITPGIHKLGKELVKNNYALGIVSASPQAWMDLVIDRLEFKNDISIIISLYERTDLEHKPSPAGYIEAMKELNVKPEATIILEDSNPGIMSAKAAGTFVIGLKQNLVAGYEQQGADVYAHTADEVINIVLKHQPH